MPFVMRQGWPTRRTAADVRHVNALALDAAQRSAKPPPWPMCSATEPIVRHQRRHGHAIVRPARSKPRRGLAMSPVIPPTRARHRRPEMPPLDLVLGDARSWEPGVSISNSFGFGGHNGTVVLRPA